MPVNCYQIAYDRAENELAQIDAQIQNLTRRKELLDPLLEPLRLLVSESDSVTIPAYAIAYEQAANEIAEIDAQIQGLPRRKELLERLLEPLKVLASESDAAQETATVSNGSFTEFSQAAAEEVADLSADDPETDPEPFKHPAPMVLLEVGEPGGHAEANGRSISVEDRGVSSEDRPISTEDIAELAYRFWDERGRAHGYHQEDWQRAAHELQSSAY
jgi:Protein of unknown function (DUF2934)